MINQALKHKYKEVLDKIDESISKRLYIKLQQESNRRRRLLSTFKVLFCCFVLFLIIGFAVKVWIVTTILDESGNVARKPEKYYVDLWCKAKGGEVNSILSDRTRPDCLLDDKVVEFDFGEKNKSYECSGQAQHYANLTGKEPLCILIRRPNMSDDDFARAVSKVVVPVECMDENGDIFPCP